MEFNEVSKRYFGPDCGGGERDLKVLTCAVLHQTGGSTAESAASYLQHRPDGSVHMCVDDDKAFLCAEATSIVCGVKDVNTWTWHVEQAGLFVTSWWKKSHRMTMKRAAWHMARIMVKADLPLVFLTSADFNAGKRHGWTTHKMLSESNVSSSTHTDPTDYPLWLYKRYLKTFYNQFKVKFPSMTAVA